MGNENYSCGNYGGHSGRAYHYLFVADVDGEYTVTLTGLDADLDLFVLEGSDCDPSSCLEESVNPPPDDEEVEFEAQAGEVFVFVVDGWNNAASDYTITLECNPDPGDDDDDDDDAVPLEDNDGDGWFTDEDCDDDNPAIHPDAYETCDAVDNDCQGGIDDGACSGCSQAEWGGHTYQFCDAYGLSWEAAAAICASYGYYLVTIDDLAENDFIELEAGGGDWWIGFNDRGLSSEGTFTWTGAPSTTPFTNWLSGEPNNSGLWPGEDCVEIAANIGWQWNDLSCNVNQEWICEL